MRITRKLLVELIEEEVGHFLEADEGEDLGGDLEPTPSAEKEKDVERAEGNLETHLSSLLDKISNEKEFAQVMRAFLNMASKHPALKTNAVRRTLLSMAKEAQNAGK